MSKLFLLVLAAFVIYLLVKGFGRKASASTRKPEEHALPEVERMVGCAHCGINLPQTEALEENGAYFCAEAHRRLGAR